MAMGKFIGGHWQNPANGQNFSIGGHWHRWCLLTADAKRNKKDKILGAPIFVGEKERQHAPPPVGEQKQIRGNDLIQLTKLSPMCLSARRSSGRALKY